MPTKIKSNIFMNWVRDDDLIDSNGCKWTREINPLVCEMNRALQRG